MKWSSNNQPINIKSIDSSRDAPHIWIQEPVTDGSEHTSIAENLHPEVLIQQVIKMNRNSQFITIRIVDSAVHLIKTLDNLDGI